MNAESQRSVMNFDSKDQLKNIQDLVDDDDDKESISSEPEQIQEKSASAKKNSSQKAVSQKSKKFAGIRLIDKFNVEDEISNPDSVIENDKIKNE